MTYIAKGPPKGGTRKGGVFIFVLFLRGLLQLPSFFVCEYTHGPLVLVVISQIVVGTPTEGGMARFRLRFRGSSCLHQNRPTKNTKSSFSCFSFAVFFSCLRSSYVGIRTGLWCSLSSHKSSWAHPRRGTWPDFAFVFMVVFVSRTKIGPPKIPNLHL